MALYQLDVRGEADQDAVREWLDDEPESADVKTQAFALATAAWGTRADADAAVSGTSVEWPSHRQPPVDRAILRLAWHEIEVGHAPVVVAINEAVELAKDFGSEHSASFVNSVLDKMHKAGVKA